MNIKTFILLVTVCMLLVICCRFLMKNKKVRVILLASVTGLIIIGIPLYNTVFYHNSDRVTLYKGAEKSISIELPNHLLYYEYYFARFNSRLSMTDIKSSLEQEYDSSFFDTERNQVVFIHNDNIYIVKSEGKSNYLWTKRNHYIFSCETISLEDNDSYIEVPFPCGVLDEGDGMQHGYERKISSSYDEIKRYYESFTNAVFSNNTIVLIYKDYRIKIVIEDGNAKFEIIR